MSDDTGSGGALSITGRDLYCLGDDDDSDEALLPILKHDDSVISGIDEVADAEDVSDMPKHITLSPAAKLSLISGTYAAAKHLPFSAQLHLYIMGSDELLEQLRHKTCSVDYLDGICDFDQHFAMSILDDVGVLRQFVTDIKEQHAKSKFKESATLFASSDTSSMVPSETSEGIDDTAFDSLHVPAPLFESKEPREDVDDSAIDPIQVLAGQSELALLDKIEHLKVTARGREASLLNLISLLYENRMNLIKKRMLFLKELLASLRKDEEELNRHSEELDDLFSFWEEDATLFLAQLPQYPPKVGSFSSHRMQLIGFINHMKTCVKEASAENEVETTHGSEQSTTPAATAQVPATMLTQGGEPVRHVTATPDTARAALQRMLSEVESTGGMGASDPVRQDDDSRAGEGKGA
jgi:hypothetical protein